MNAYSDELRLLWVVLLNGGVFAAAYRFARRRGSSGALQALCDAFLLYFLTQYIAVGLPGLFGAFTARSMTLVALIATAGMLLAANFVTWPSRPCLVLPTSKTEGEKVPSRSAPAGTGGTPVSRSSIAAVASHPWTLDHLGLVAAALFAGGYLAAYAWSLRFIPPFATDSLVYQLPMAVQWIQTHRLGIYPTWYWNPAASYSPGTGSMFMAWWMAAAGNDLFVRFVQLPPLMFIFFLVARMCRLLGCTRTAAGLIAIGATLSRPLFSEAIFPKDDLYVTSFIAAGVLALAQDVGRALPAMTPLGGQCPPYAPDASPLPVRRERVRVRVFHAILRQALIPALSRSTGRGSKTLERKCAAVDPLGPWRVGAAIGFVLASKYTVLLACPIFLFLVDAPFRARWRLRHWIIAVGIVLVMALPWYVRNILLTSNPLYPVDVHLPGLMLRGLFGTERDHQLRSAAGVWHMISETYHSLPTPLIVLLLGGWAWACIRGGRSIVRDPLPRACVIGSVATLILFLATSPHHEVRYIFPLIVLWFAGLGFALARNIRWNGSRRGRAESENPDSAGRGQRDPAPVRQPRIPLLIALLVAVISTITTFSTDLIASVVQFAGTALLIATVGAGIAFLQIRVLRLSRESLRMAVAIAILIVALAGYVQWHAYVRDYQHGRFDAWGFPGQGYPLQAPIWKWVDENVPADATVAYANTFFVYPYYGFGLTRRVGYAPVRKGLHDFPHFPRMGDRLPGDLIVRRMTEVMNENPDRDTWIENLRAMNAGYLIAMKHDPDNPDLSADPPELRFARAEPGVFVQIEETEAGVVFRIQ